MLEHDLDEVIRKTPLFSQLTAEERAEIESIGRVVRARAGSTLIRQGDEAGGMSVVIEGRVRVDLELPDGRRETLATLSRGDVFGELSLLDRFPRSASAVAASDSLVFLLNGTEFDRIRQAYRPAAFKILRAIGPILCRRLRSVNQAIGEKLAEHRRQHPPARRAPAPPPPSESIAPPAFEPPAPPPVRTRTQTGTMPAMPPAAPPPLPPAALAEGPEGRDDR